MGLRAYIHKSNLGKCANGGISDKCDTVTIINASGPSEPSDDAPAVKIAKNVMGEPIIVPADKPTGSVVGPMMGGCFVSTSDSRFREAVERITGRSFYGALAFHDRYETYAQNQSLNV